MILGFFQLSFDFDYMYFARKSEFYKNKNCYQKNQDPSKFFYQKSIFISKNKISHNQYCIK